MVIDDMLARGNKRYVFTFSPSIKESPRMTSRNSESKVKLGEEMFFSIFLIREVLMFE